MKSVFVRVTLIRAIVVALMTTLSPLTAHAQEVTLAGSITDATDAVLPGATVTAVHVESGNAFVGVADANGEYRIGSMRPGIYRVTAELSGFSSVVRENLELLVGQRATVNFKLALSSVSETITVTGASPLVDVVQSKLGGNVDSRQLSELPVNGRNWMDLTMLAPGSNANAVGESPVVMANQGQAHAGDFQLNLDGQQVSNMMACARWGQPKFSRDAIGEFEFISSRFDATQGRSIGVQVNAVTKAGTNNFAGTLSGYFRDDSFNAKDFIVDRVLPYSNQQISTTFGGPFRQDRNHFFGYYEGEREPQAYFFNSAYPRFNISDLTGTRTEHKGGARFDNQLNESTRLMTRANIWRFWQPYTDAAAGGSTGGNTLHPSRASSKRLESNTWYANLTKTFGGRVVNELKPGYNYITSQDEQVVQSPQISLQGNTIGQEVFKPLYLTNQNFSLRDDLTIIAGRHEMKAGGEWFRHLNTLFWPSNKFGALDALGGSVPGNIEDIFPVWNDPNTWNLAALSPIARTWTQSVSNNDYTIERPRHDIAFWFQDNWRLNRLTVNLGIRWDGAFNSVGEDINFPPFRTPQGHDWNNVAPRTGFAYSLNDRTVIRGGWGLYYMGYTDQPAHHSRIDLITIAPTVFNDGRADFASNPYNGQTLSFDQALQLAGRRSTTGIIASPTLDTSYTYQTSFGVQRQIGDTMSIQADYVLSQNRHEMLIRNANLVYNPATGLNYPFNQVRVYNDWNIVNMRFSDGASDSHSLQTAFTRRMSNNFQISATYTLNNYYYQNTVPRNPGCQYPMSATTPTSTPTCDTPITLAPDFPQDEWYLSGAQRHRGVISGIWQMPAGLQLSGLYFAGSGINQTSVPGADIRQTGSAGYPGRLTAQGNLIQRNDIDVPALHRVDMRLLRRFRLGNFGTIDGMLEVFNLFNHANYASLNSIIVSPTYRRPVRDANVSYAPRMVQLGFRLVF
ncbi:MAG: carboxypeptidase regulatory-like domain-containing protein [Vicinamibacterales bacterium]